MNNLRSFEHLIAGRWPGLWIYQIHKASACLFLNLVTASILYLSLTAGVRISGSELIIVMLVSLTNIIALCYWAQSVLTLWMPEYLLVFKVLPRWSVISLIFLAVSVLPPFLVVYNLDEIKRSEIEEQLSVLSILFIQAIFTFYIFAMARATGTQVNKWSKNNILTALILVGLVGGGIIISWLSGSFVLFSAYLACVFGFIFGWGVLCVVSGRRSPRSSFFLFSTTLLCHFIIFLAVCWIVTRFSDSQPLPVFESSDFKYDFFVSTMIMLVSELQFKTVIISIFPACLLSDMINRTASYFWILPSSEE